MPIAQAVGQGADLRDALNAHAERQDLRTAGGHPLRFIPQGALPPGAAYEAHIAASGGVPTRDNLHDFFNALIWLHWPRTKAMLNARQASAIARDGIGAARGAVRDAATLFDENALIFLHSSDVPERCLTGFDWPACSSRAGRPGAGHARCCRSATRCWRSWSRRTSRSPPTLGPYVSCHWKRW